ncbi:MAG: hypothetical protein JNM93_01185 [Bacteriovoracaceae bacterium]|nr:hypothetical protein [Bacteriovoracaceae bacterium]
MNKFLVLTAALSFSLTALAQNNVSSTKTKRNNRAASINTALQVELGLDNMSGDSNVGVSSSSVAPGNTTRATRDGSANALRASVRKNYSLGNGIYTSFGGTLRLSRSDDSMFINDGAGNQNYKTTRNITEIVAEQRLGKLMGINVFGKNLNIRPFTAISLGARQVAMNYDSLNMQGDSRSTGLVLMPSIGTEVLISSDFTASLTLSQTNIKTDAVNTRLFANSISFSETNDAVTLISLGLAYNF